MAGWSLKHYDSRTHVFAVVHDGVVVVRQTVCGGVRVGQLVEVALVPRLDVVRDDLEMFVTIYALLFVPQTECVPDLVLDDGRLQTNKQINQQIN